MIKKMVLSLSCVMLMVSAVFALDVTIRVKPDRIITNSVTGTDKDIKVSIPISVASMDNVKVTLTLEGEGIVEGSDVKSEGWKYCAIDDVLHIYFDKKKMIGALGDADGEVKVTLDGYYQNGDDEVVLHGEDWIEVLSSKNADPDPEKHGDGPGDSPWD